MMFNKIGTYCLTAVFLCVLTLTLLYSREVSTPLPDIHPGIPPFTQTLSTDTWGIFDAKTGKIITGHNTDRSLPIASVTKLFTAEAVLRSEKQDISFTINDSDLAPEGRSGKLMKGQTVTPYELLYPLLIESSNDAAEAIERSLGDDFVRSIQTTTESLALHKTKITEPTGLSPENLSSVEDLSRFYVHVRRDNPHILDITQLNTYIGSETGYLNNNPARSLATFTGGKHGYTDEAHKTFVGTFMLPSVHAEVGIVILKSDNLVSDIETLLAYSEGLYVP